MRVISDAAKRMSDTYNLHRVADPYGSIGKWLAFRLSDGDSDRTLYDTKQAAVSHQHHNEDYYAFTQIGPWDLPPGEAETFLTLHRKMYDKGIRLADPTEKSGGRDMIRRVDTIDMANQVRAALIGDVAPTNIKYSYREKAK